MFTIGITIADGYAFNNFSFIILVMNSVIEVFAALGKGTAVYVVDHVAFVYSIAVNIIYRQFFLIGLIV